MYYLEHRYQDSGWVSLPDINSPFKDLDRARRRASKLSQNSIAYGMVRVVDYRGVVWATFAAGGGEIKG